LREEYQLTEDQALEMITSLQTRGTIRLETQPVPESFGLASYLKSSQSLWYLITILASILAAIVIFVTPEKIAPWNHLRNVLGSVFVLLLPGYSFMRTLFPVQTSTVQGTQVSIGNLDTVERTALSLGLSLALVAIIGLLLNYTSFGIRLTPVFWSLFILTCIFATAASIREYRAKGRVRALHVDVRPAGR
jgi:uncharacterized membrane protein